MDNLTHSLVGAIIGQTGLKRKTGLAMPTLIIAANIPDIDAGCVIYGVESLAMRRGLTHGPIAMLVLPVLLWALMIGFDAWQGRRGKRPAGRLPIHRGWLLSLAFVGCLSHPAFDWLNNYGVRLFEPFSSRWLYGDSIFIIDVWIWAALIAAIWLSLRRERRGAGQWTRPAWVGIAAIGAYIFANGIFTGVAETKAAARVATMPGATVELVVASPPPIAFWRRDIFWRGSMAGKNHAGSFTATAFDGANPVIADGGAARPTGMDSAAARRAADANPDVRAFLFWSRMPLADVAADGAVTFSDQRFANPLSRGQFTVTVQPNAKR